MVSRVPLAGRDIICVGFADWDSELWTNQQHLMSRLARDNNVLFIESLGLRRPTVAARDVRRLARRLRRGLQGVRPADGLHVLSPLVLPLHAKPWQARLNVLLLRAQVRRAVRTLGMSRPILWGYVPQAGHLVEVLKPSTVVYHCVDDIAKQRGIDGEAFRAGEAFFLGQADLVLASAPTLRDRLAQRHDNVRFAPNVADTEQFALALDHGVTDHAIAALRPPRIVFTGAVVATKLDIELLVGLARRRREWSFALVGPIGVGDPSTDVSPLAAEPNVHLLGRRRYEDLPGVLRAADIAIVPYAVNDLTRSIFPMKIYEYLSAGLDVVSTPLPSLAGVSGVRIAAGIDEVEGALASALANDTPELRRQRSELARDHSWTTRLEEIASWLEATCAR
jgi:glycosyltransferase involved in cell wall biosynthesis